MRTTSEVALCPRPTRPGRDIPQAEPVTSSTDGSDALDKLIEAAGALVGWRSAVLWDCGSDQSRAVVKRTWQSLGARAISVPTWDECVDRSAWDDNVVMWRAARDGAPATVAVRAAAEDGTAAVLAFFGPELTPPCERVHAVLEAVADLLCERRPWRDVARGEHRPTLEQTVALVDVFAYTVKLGDSGRFEWLYFGPNSGTVFGRPVTPDADLTSLMRRHVHVDDFHNVGEVERAAIAGEPLDIVMRIVGSDDITRWVSWRIAPRRFQGHLYLDGVATDVSPRYTLSRTWRDLAQAQMDHAKQQDTIRERAAAVRDGNDNVLQRIFAAGLRLQMLMRNLSGAEAHAAAAIAFQLDQSATDLRLIIKDLNEVTKR